MRIRTRMGFVMEGNATHCKRGHPFDAENTYITHRGMRSCKTCQRMHVNDHASRKRKLNPPKSYEDRARARFWSKVEMMTNGCWEWTGSKNTYGYGVIGWYRRRVGAHRISYELSVGPIPEGLEIDHLCRNRACVNPQHLEPVTRKENGLRGTNFCAVNARKTHCIHGHEFTPENTYRQRASGGRGCRTCQREAYRRYRMRKRESRKDVSA